MMKTCRILFLLGALLGLSGCPEVPCFDGGVAAPQDANSGVILMGEEVRLRVSPSFSDGCGNETPERPASLTVEVSGPDNLNVPSEAALGKPASSSATVVFTPDKPGRYHVFAAFDPVGGIHQFDLYAARNRSTEAQLYTLSRMCGSVERTTRGGWVCDSDFVRDGTVVRGFTGARLAVAGDVVWAVSSTQTQRFVDTGTALELTATLAGGASSTEFLLPSENELLAIRTPGVDRIVFDGSSTLVLKGSEFIPVFSGTIGSTTLKNILLRSGDELRVITNIVPPSGQLPNTFTSQACPYRIEPDRIARGIEPCERFTGDVVGYEPTGLWVGTRFSFGEGVSDLRWVEFTGGKLVEQASIPFGLNFEVVRHTYSLRNTAVPVIVSSLLQVDPRLRPTMPVYLPDRRAIELEFVDAEIPLPSASTSLMWGGTNTSSTGMRIRVRPTTP